MGCGSKTEVLDMGVEGYEGVKVDFWRFLEQGTDRRVQEKNEEGKRAHVFKKDILEL